MLRHSHEKKQPLMLQIAASHRSVRYNTDLSPPSHSKLLLQVLSMVLYKRWRGDRKHKVKDRPFMPKYGTVSQVLLLLVVTTVKKMTASRSGLAGLVVRSMDCKGKNVWKRVLVLIKMKQITFDVLIFIIAWLLSYPLVAKSCFLCILLQKPL